jgi:hypothetical protein
MLVLLLVACGPSDSRSPAGADGADTATNAVLGGAPTAPVVAIDPRSPTDDEDLHVVLVTESADPEGAAVTYRHAWTVDGVAHGDADHIYAEVTEDGQIWTVETRAWDGERESAAGVSRALIGNHPPVAPRVHLEPAVAEVGEPIAIVWDEPATDPDGHELTSTVDWFVDDVEETYAENDTVLEGRWVLGGRTFRAVVATTDGWSDPVVTEATAVSVNQGPVIDQVAIDPAEPRHDDALHAVFAATDPDDTPLTIHYRWYRNGTEVTALADLDTVDATIPKLDDVWEVEVEASDGFTSARLLSDPVTIQLRGWRMDETARLRVSNDRVLSGTWEMWLDSADSTRGDNACDVFWDITWDPEPSVCPSCDFSFSLTAEYNPYTSTVGIGCQGLLMNGEGYVTYDYTTTVFTGAFFGPNASDRVYDGYVALELYRTASGWATDDIFQDYTRYALGDTGGTTLYAHLYFLSLQ